MKKMKPIFFAACTILMLSSCIKTYSCSCVDNYSGTSTTTTTSLTEPKKSLAQTACEGQNSSSGGYSKTCTLSK